MGSYLNPGSKAFQMAMSSEIFIDKSRLIEKTNRCICTMQRFMCVSRPRRFGKSMAADMLVAYYEQEEDTSNIFNTLQISKSETYKEHLNKYDVIKVNMQDFLSCTDSVDEMLKFLQKRIISDLKRKYPQYVEGEKLAFVMKDVYAYTKHQFVILIDEWDCLFREYQQDREAQKKYLDFLRSWLKDQEYVALAYMTGILPIKKYGSHSALNMFTEYSMLDTGDLAEFFGFTEDEVKMLCAEYDMNYEEAKRWYDGYGLVEHNRHGNIKYSIYSPKSLVEAMLKHRFGTYWNQTETYEALKKYIQMDMNGLKNDIIKMLAGEKVRINTGTFSNDMTTFATKDDILTLLVHLGYLTYDSEMESVSIPNSEVSQEYINAISTMDWKNVIESVDESRNLLKCVWNMDAENVAKGIQKAHEEISILEYNDENSLSCTIGIAFYFAREYYNIIRELPTGKGFADICFIPQKAYLNKPAIIIELKWNKSAVGAIEQIKANKYAGALKEYKDNMLLVGINYDKKTKKHECIIEKYE